MKIVWFMEVYGKIMRTDGNYRKCQLGCLLLILLIGLLGCEDPIAMTETGSDSHSPIDTSTFEEFPTDTETDTESVPEEIDTNHHFDSDTNTETDTYTEPGEVDSGFSEEEDYDLIVLVEESKYDSLRDHIAQYVSDLQNDDIWAYVVIWEPGTVQTLKWIIKNEIEIRHAEGVFLIGDLPTAWYEQWAFDEWEEFPTDLYLMDLDNTFYDNNYNNIIDWYEHYQITIEIYVSRLVGTVDEIQRYFEKVHSYRTEGSSLAPSAYVFMDDDWTMYDHIRSLDSIYSELIIDADDATNTRAAYVNQLSGDGAQFVSQWIHSSPSVLYFGGYDQLENFDINDVAFYNLKGHFYNLFNCSVSRFTQPNLSMAYLLGTDWGLATVGSTKVGGMYNDSGFHLALSGMYTWGEAFKYWFNVAGNTNDEWFLGMAIQGDPMLTVSGDVAASARYSSKAIHLDPKEQEALYDKMSEVSKRLQVDSYSDYQKSNPTFFKQ